MLFDPKSETKMRLSGSLSLSVSRLLLMLLMLCSSLGTSNGGAFVGVNIGTDVSNMPSASDVVALLKRQNITHVRLFDADRQMLLAMANSSIQVMVTLPNNQLLGIGQSSSSAANWVNKNVAAYLPNTNITAIAVGSEVLTTLPNAALVLVPAMKFLHAALVAANLDGQVKVTSPQATDIIVDPFPPSSAVFNSSWNRVMTPMLSFLRDSNSYLTLNVYPYYVYVQSNGIFPLDYALFRTLPANKEVVDSNTLLHYTNVFDSLIDAAYFSMAFMNFTDISVVVTESGWPSMGGPSETDATVENAETYNSNLVAHVLNNTGTPKHPGIAVNTYIYELFNEDLRPGATSEKNWGLFSANSTPVYSLTGTVSILANDTTGESFCVAISGTDTKLLQAALDWSCGSGGADCQAIQVGGSCYEPNTVADHASYAFNTYYHKMGMQTGACSFNGVAMVTPTDPSHDSCNFTGSLKLGLA
ncbi:glucan endo-1,3-beta-glucosidase 3 isoform X2 [Cryptomeria japonica]|uniref:glucan endo-1,3-beta-glucosidase 3 isoform X2 n=1 Tax=Cryptomeria japonica TaxID=3369 RepID=UPI0027DA0D5F|nr:glucan endo-1,3-beta-glucosidase 3 isoform X2 [Cryptomeria japonica]